MKKLIFAFAATATSLLAVCASSPNQATAPAAAPTVAVKPAAKAMAANISGTWMLSVETPMGARDMKLTATQNGEVLTGAIAIPRGDVPITGTVRGNAVVFTMKVNAQGMDMHIDYAGMVESDSIKAL
jgi:hypothetical protein